MTPREAWEYAASWGSYMRSGDPGACMYGFDEDCRPQSEEHRQRVIDHLETCQRLVRANPQDYDKDELKKMDAFVRFRRP